MPIRRKYHSECNHKNFGTFCHKCKPNDPRDSARALQGHYGLKVQCKEEELLKGKKKTNGQTHLI